MIFQTGVKELKTENSRKFEVVREKMKMGFNPFNYSLRSRREETKSILSLIRWWPGVFL